MNFLKTIKGQIIIASSIGVILLITIVLMVTGTISSVNLMGNSVQKINIGDTTIKKISTQYMYTNSDNIKPEVEIKYGRTILTENKDYTVRYINNNAPGIGQVIITGIGNYTSKTTVDFKIESKIVKKISIAQVQMKALDKLYTGKSITPTITATYNNKTLVNGIDYKLNYKTIINPGQATVTVTGIGNYQGTRNLVFMVKKIESNKVSYIPISRVIVNTLPNQIYTGKAVTPLVTVKDSGVLLRNGVDYTLSYRNNINIGIAQVIINGKGKYQGTKTINFNIINPMKIQNTTRNLTTGVCSSSFISFEVVDISEANISKIDVSIDNGRTWKTITSTNIKKISNSIWRVTIKKSYPQIKFRVTNSRKTVQIFGNFKTCVNNTTQKSDEWTE